MIITETIRYTIGLAIVCSHPIVAVGPDRLLELATSNKTRDYLLERLAKGELVFGYWMDNWMTKVAFVLRRSF